MRTDRKELYEYCKQWALDKRILILQGLRRTGKTTLLLDLMTDNNDGSHKIFYEFNVWGKNDDLELQNILSLINSNKNDKYTLYLDEFQEYYDWNRFFKTIYDIHPNVKIVATGSVSHNTSATNNTEGGRYHVIQIYTLSFDEYMSIHTNGTYANEQKLFDYITMGSYPDADWNSRGFSYYKKQVNDNILEKIKNAKLLQDNKIQNVRAVDSVLQHIILNVGNFQSPSSISNALKIDEAIIKKIIEYLKNSFLIKEINVFHKQKGKASMWNSKYYLSDVSMFGFINSKSFEQLFKSDYEVDRTYANFLVENVVYTPLLQREEFGFRNLFYYKDNQADIDFVFETPKMKHYIEVKTSKNIDCLSKQQKQFASNNKLNVIYFGTTTVNDGINYINIIDFLLNYKTIDFI